MGFCCALPSGQFAQTIPVWALLKSWKDDFSKLVLKNTKSNEKRPRTVFFKRKSVRLQLSFYIWRTNFFEGQQIKKEAWVIYLLPSYSKKPCLCMPLGTVTFSQYFIEEHFNQMLSFLTWEALRTYVVRSNQCDQKKIAKCL